MMKIVMIVNTELPAGLIANTTAVLGISLGNMKHEIVGPDVTDASGMVHKGITEASVPVLSADGDTLKTIYEKSIVNEGVDVIDFNRTAQSCRHYTEYTKKLSAVENEKLEFSGLCLTGSKKAIDKLTGSLGLYR